MKIAILGDWHAPALDLDMLEWAHKIYRSNKCEMAIQVGDVVDAKAWSRFPKSPEDDSPAVEWEKTEQQLKEASKIFKKLHLIEGNHCGRLMRKALEASLPRALIRSLDEVFSFPGWTWHMGDKPLLIDNCVFVHGDEAAATRGNKCVKYGKSVIQGHTHQAALTYTPTFYGQMFDAEVGCMVDETHSAFAYAAKSARRVWKGIVIVIDGKQVEFIPYEGGRR